MKHPDIAKIVENFKASRVAARKAGYVTANTQEVGINLLNLLRGKLKTPDYTITASDVARIDAEYVKGQDFDWSDYLHDLPGNDLDRYLEKNFTFEVAKHVFGLVSIMLQHSSDECRQESTAASTLAYRLQKLSIRTFDDLCLKYPDVLSFLPSVSTNDNTLAANILYNNNTEHNHEVDIDDMLRTLLPRLGNPRVTINSVIDFAKSVPLEQQPLLIQAAYLDVFYNAGRFELIKPEHLAIRELGINFDKILDAANQNITAIALPTALTP